MAAAVSSTQQQQAPMSMSSGHQWKETAKSATVAASASPENHTATLKHLHLVSQAIERVIMEKQAAKAAAVTTTSPSEVELSGTSESSTTTTNDLGLEKVEEAWDAFGSAFENAKSCVEDVMETETPELWQEEMETAEEAMTQAQAAYLDVLDIARECEVHESRREEAAVYIKQLRKQLDRLTEPENNVTAAL
eukprot:CAMPEP_0198143454 /NCGR_PEP_ID=MMETSP1443-20131203/7627_1 /TAXON_ID=186043 /ORGANISM="Entomoneis sp., Strain CCMP2396" /LENGTH=192 /DNA_ID=CAMNT_0043806693 /DNA_START=102 /DNA_END=680 /DNA_ORIENTATION=-